MFLTLKDLADKKTWQGIQDRFAEVSGICVRILDENSKPYTNPSNTPKLCIDFLKNYRNDREPGICLPTFLGGNEVVDINLSYPCHADLRNYIVPIRLQEGRVLGYIILGPVVLISLKNKEKYAQTAEELNIPLDELWNELLEVKIVSLRGIKSMVKFIEDISDYTIQSAYNHLLKETSTLTKINKIFDILLDVAFEISQADIGSIMALNSAGSDLTIQASKGIPEDIINNTKVKLGEGISGIAAKEDRSFLINDQPQDNRIKSYLNRPYIGSSMIVPIKTENRVVGVMNLGALKKSETKFNEENIQAITKLMSLVNAAV